MCDCRICRGLVEFMGKMRSTEDWKGPVAIGTTTLLLPITSFVLILSGEKSKIRHKHDVFIAVIKSTNNMSYIFRFPRHPVRSGTGRGGGNLCRTAGKWAVGKRGYAGWWREGACSWRRAIDRWVVAGAGWS